jgi:RNA polymerase sigma factor (sigma-70 family)
MTTGQATVLLRRVCRFAGAGGADRLADAELLGRFVARRDEAAFEALVRRHGPMVWGVCRRVLRDAHATEDAFQAVFLVLVRSAASVRKRQSVSCWLYGVARRLALKARTRAARRRERESRATQAPPADPAAEVTLREAREVLDEELARLPEKYRAPILLCCLEGLARDEAAGRLGWSAGTLKSRLEEARSLLRTRLARRGLTLSAALAAALLAPAASPATISPILLASTCRAASLLAGGNAAAIAPRVLTLAEGAVRSAAVARLKAIAVLSLALTLAAGAGLAVCQAPSAKAPAAGVPDGSPRAMKERAAAERPRDALPEGALLRLGSSLFRHSQAIRNAALSPDGKLLATSAYNSVIVWELASGKRLHRFSCDHGLGFTCPGLTFSPDGRHLGFVHGDNFACVWDLSNGKEVLRFENDSRGWAACRFSADGKQFALSNQDRMRFYDLASRKEAHAVPAEHISHLSPDARTYVRTDEQKETLLGDTRTGQVSLRLKVAAAHNGIENGVAFTRDGKRLALVDRVKKVIELRDMPGGKVRLSFPLPGAAWPEPSKERSSRYGEYRMNFSADGTVLLLGTGRGLVHRWDLTAGKELPPLKTPGNVTAVHGLPDGRRIITTGADGLIRLWDARTGWELAEPEAYVGKTRAALSADGRVAALADERGRLDLWDMARGKARRQLLAKGPAVAGLALSPDGKILAAALVSGVIRLWDVPSGESGKTYRWDKGPDLTHVHALLFSPDGRDLLVIDRQQTSWLFALPAGDLRWRGPAAQVAAFSPDGTTLALARWETHLALVDVATGKERKRFPLGVQENPRLFHGVSALALSPDGRWVALSQGDGRVAVYDARDGKRLKLFQAVDRFAGNIRQLALHRSTHQVKALAFSPDGRWLLTGASDASVRVWETLTGKEVLRRDGHDGGVSYAAFAADGRTAFSCGEDGQGYLWDLRPSPATGPRPSAEALWESLAGADAAAAYRTVWALAEDRAAVKLLRAKLRPVPLPDRERLALLVADLSSTSFRAREGATKALRELGDVAAPVLKEALKRRPTEEVRRRLEQLLLALRHEPTVEEVRLVRAVLALELAGTADARAVLRTWAGGAPGAHLTEEARGALDRLGRVGK